MVGSELEFQLREAAMAWLDQQARAGDRLPGYHDLASFTFGGRRVPLLDIQRGIRKPAMLGAALSIRTSFTPPGQAPPYQDAQGPDGLLRYKYRGDDPDHPENAALRNAWRAGLPVDLVRGGGAKCLPTDLPGLDR